MDAIVNGPPLRVSAFASCVGGTHPDPPLDDFPLLAWAPRDNERVAPVRTEDGKASVYEVAVEFARNPYAEAVAARLGTTADHVAQAVNYAARAGVISFAGG